MSNLFYQNMEECPFCGIANKKIPSLVVYEDDNFMAILDIRPANKGHTILFPKKHKTSIFDLNNSETNKIFYIAKQLIKNVKATTNCDGVNLVYSIGEAAGQRVPHMIIHIIPRNKGDKVAITWEPQKISEEEFKKIAEELLKANKNISEKVIEEKKEKIITEEELKKIKPAEIIEIEPREPKYW